MSFDGLKSRLVSGSFWAIAGELTAGGARVLSYIVYAKLLSPTDFGLLGFCLLIINLFPLLIDNSLGLALMRHPDEDQNVYSTIYYLNIGLAVVAILLLYLLAPWAADLAHDRRIEVILPILGIQLLFNAFCSVHIAIARRRFQYRRLLPVRLIATACSLALGIPFALLGYAYWALVISSLAAAVGQMLAAQVLLGWRPSLRFDWTAAKGLSGFTSWVAVDMGVTWMVMSGGGFFLAFYLGAHDLGLFRLSDQIDTYLIGLVLNPLIPVLYRGFCEVAMNRGASWGLFERSIKILTPIALGLGGVIIVCARPLQQLIGARWMGVADIIVVNAIADAASYSILSAPSLLRAHGLAKVVAIMRLVTVAVQVAVYFVVARHGVIAFVLGKLALEITIYIATLIVLKAIFARQVLQLVRDQLRIALVVILCALAAIVAARGAAEYGALPALITAVAVFCAPLSVYFMLTERQLLAAVLNSRMAAK